MNVKLGHTAISCRHCGTMTAVENEALETLREFVCPSCGVRMTDYELAVLKMHYYALMCGLYMKHWGTWEAYTQFDYHINIRPHYETKQSEQKETD